MKNTKPARRGRGPRPGPRIVAALTELTESLERGEALPHGASARIVEAPAEPGVYAPEAIRALREGLGAPREVFAGMLGVSPATVQSLELGRREPSRPLRRLFDEFAREPGRWKRLVHARLGPNLAAALATLEELRQQVAALPHRDSRGSDPIDARLDELRDAIHGRVGGGA